MKPPEIRLEEARRKYYKHRGAMIAEMNRMCKIVQKYCGMEITSTDFDVGLGGDGIGFMLKKFEDYGGEVITYIDFNTILDKITKKEILDEDFFLDNKYL